ncbi:MAG: ROK family protein [Oliverpabstia sp.]
MKFEKTLAIDIGGTFIKFGVVEENGEISEHYKIPTLKTDDAGQFYDYVYNNIRDIKNIKRIGISVPGLIDREFNVRSSAAPNLTAIYNTNISKEIEKRTQIHTTALNDGKAAGLCEVKLGRGKGTYLSAYLIIGTGGGGCICLGDKILGGVDNFAGEFHFMAYPSDDNVVKVGRTIGMMGLINSYNEKVDEKNRVTLGEEITKRALQGEETAEKIVNQWIHRIAVQCLNLIVVLNPDILCIGGGISEEDWFIERVKAEYFRISYEHFNHNTPFLTTVIDRCQYRNDANLLGAAIKANE